MLLRKAFNDIFKDPQFLSEWKKLAGEKAHPLSGEQPEKAIRELPREDEIVAFFNTIGGSGIPASQALNWKLKHHFVDGLRTQPTINVILSREKDSEERFGRLKVLRGAVKITHGE